MALLTFKGGIHPDDGKSLAKDKAIVDVKPKGDLVYPLSQHIGAPATPIVAKGDHVLRGQKIAEAGGFVSAPIYASVSGTVKAIEPHFNPTGAKVNCIVVENDGEYKEVEYAPVKPFEEMTKEEILNAIGEAGVVGMGGAGFPTKVKLSPKEPEKIDYIIANCAECEPYITADYRRMMETPERLVGGSELLSFHCLNMPKVFLAWKIISQIAFEAERNLQDEPQRKRGIKDQQFQVVRASADLCYNRASNQLYYASGRCGMCCR